MEITAAMVKQLREQTGAGMMQCKWALAEAEGDVAKATEALRRMGLASVAKRADRVAAEGLIEAYVHPGSKIGALVEVNCETDFVARTEEFARLCHDVALQVAATGPRWVRLEDVPEEVIEDQRRQARDRLANASPGDVEQQVAKEVERFLEETVLLRQPGIRDPSQTVGEMVIQLAAKLGENIRVGRFSYFRLGGNQ